MVKNSIKTFILAMTVILFVACSGKPKNMRDDTYELGTKALKIEEQYLNADITAEDAYERLETVYNRLDELTFTDEELLASSKNTIVTSSIANFQLILAMNIEYSTNRDPRETYESLKKTLSN